MSMREKTQADFDLEKMFEYLDEALTSRDERVQSALRGLLTIIELTRTQDDGHMAVETSRGPLRQLQEDVRNLSRRVMEVERELSGRAKYTPPGATPQNPYSGSPWWGVTPPGPYTTSKSTSSGSIKLTDNSNDVTLTQTITQGKKDIDA